MVGSGTRRSRSGWWLAGFTVASLLMLLASQTDPAQALQQAGARALEPVRAAFTGIGDGVARLFSTMGEIDRLRTANETLSGQLAAAEQRIAQLQEAAAENAELRGLLGLTKTLKMQLLPVRVIARDPSNLSWEVGIDAGTASGVRVGMPVVADANGAGALAGTVVSAASDTAQVRFIVDPRSSAVALDQQTRATGLIEGQLGGQLVLVRVPVTDKLRVGDSIVTAGLSLGAGLRSPFPKGLLVGTIQAVQTDDNALTQTAFVRPALDLSSLERLLVITSFVQD